MCDMCASYEMQEYQMERTGGVYFVCVCGLARVSLSFAWVSVLWWVSEWVGILKG